eukprot:200088_1
MDSIAGDIDESYYVAVTANGRIKFKIFQDQDIRLIHRYLAGDPFVINSTRHTLTLIAMGPMYRMYVDGIFQLDIDDDTLRNGVIGIRATNTPAIYYSLNMTTHRAFNAPIESENVSCDDIITGDIREYQIDYYKFYVDMSVDVSLHLDGNNSDRFLDFYLFDHNYTIVIACKQNLQCDGTPDESRFYVGTLTQGSYIMAVGDANYDGDNDATYLVEIICTNPKTISVSSSALEIKWIIIIIVSTVSFIVLLIIYCRFHCKKKRSDTSSVQRIESCSSSRLDIINNALVAIIAIGNYDKNAIANGDEDVSAIIQDLDVERDINHLNEIFGEKFLNYKVLPENTKTEWTANQILQFLINDVGTEICKQNKNGDFIYDGLIVCLSCHGLKDRIITSDYKTIEKTAIHRTLSNKYPQIRAIPRIFIFDSCDGSSARVSSLNIKECRAFEQKTDEYSSSGVQQMPAVDRKQASAAKGYELKHVSHRANWTTSQPNPDWKLCEIHGANPGFQSKFNTQTGSYLLYEFSKKIKENMNMNNNKTLGEIFEIIQNELHNRGKQQIKKVFYNGIERVQLMRNNSELEHKENKKQPSLSFSISLLVQRSRSKYQSVNVDEQLTEDEDCTSTRL